MSDDKLADLRMPGGLEALDGILAQVDGGWLGPGEAMEALLGAQITLRNTRRLAAAMRASWLPAVKTPPTSTAASSPRFDGSSSTACTRSASSSAERR